MQCPHCNQPAQRLANAARLSYQCVVCGRIWRPRTTLGGPTGAPASLDPLSGASAGESSVTIRWRAPPKRLITPTRAVLAAATCCLLLFAAWGVQKARHALSARPEDEPAPVGQAPLETPHASWMVDPAQAAQLGEEAGIGRYRLRIPEGFATFPVRQQPRWLPRNATFHGIGWLQTPERKALLVVHEVKYATAAANGADLEAALDRFYDRLQQHVRATGFSARPLQGGTLGDKPFIKGAFSGKLRFDQDLPRVERAGQVIIYLEGESEFTAYFFCDDDAGRELFSQLETALVTLRITGPSAVNAKNAE
ncbi:MAG TPA: hypothetical protein VHC19_18420 [Pirellulales bacterium]|nr:hypothetical protein [Pirellulales bacterium]